MPLFKPPAKVIVPALSAGVLAVAATLWAQGGTPGTPAASVDPDYSRLHLETNLGSFKMLDGEGTVDISFTGTILISQLKGGVTPGPGLRKEFEEKGKQAWHGKGRLVIKGSFRAVQWFGTGMTTEWHGKGRVRVYGDYDKNLQTGKYWYLSDPSRKIAWSTFGQEVSLPEYKVGGTGKPVEKRSGG